MTRGERKEFLIFSIFLTGLIVLFFWPILFGSKGFLYGDYRLQFYPWAKVLSESFKHFQLPLWTPEMGCGFPLLAEGQCAALYPPNWLLFFFLPFEFAYHFSFILLFFLAGALTYFFSKSVGVSLPGSCLAALVYLFGSVYAGLAYGVMSLRVMAWLPLSLFFIERLCRFAEMKDACFLAVAWALAFLGGYPQLACYGALFGALYFFLRLAVIPSHPKSRGIVFFFLAAALAAGLSACQLLPTFELAQQSGRAGAAIEFALQKSFNPLNLAALLWPGYEKFFGFGFYVGIIPLCLAFLAFRLIRKNRYAFIFCALALLFIFMAFGGFNPLYVFLVKITHFYFFRVPSKFIFLAGFSLAMLAGMGLDFLLDVRDKTMELFLNCAKNLFLAAIGIYAAGFLASRLFKPRILAWGKTYVRRMIYQKSGHAGTLESYLERLNILYQAVLEKTRLTDPHFLGLLLVWGVFFAVLYWKRDRFFERRNVIFFTILLTAADLFSFSFFSTGFRGNQRNLSTVAPDDEINFLFSKEGRFRTYEMVTDPVEGAPVWLPNSNMLFGYSSVGVYSPLAIGAYRDFLKDLGAVDNASGMFPASKASILKNLNLLSLMNVRFIITRENLDDTPGLRQAFVSTNGDRIYENIRYLPRAFLTRSLRRSGKNDAQVLWEENMLVPNQTVQWDASSSAQLKLKVSAPDPAFLFLSEMYYPGWEARVDGQRADIVRTNGVFRGLDIAGGSHEVEFAYHPQAFKKGCIISAVSLLICFGMLAGSFSRKKIK